MALRPPEHSAVIVTEQLVIALNAMQTARSHLNGQHLSFSIAGQGVAWQLKECQRECIPLFEGGQANFGRIEQPGRL